MFFFAILASLLIRLVQYRRACVYWIDVRSKIEIYSRDSNKRNEMKSESRTFSHFYILIKTHHEHWSVYFLRKHLFLCYVIWFFCTIAKKTTILHTFTALNLCIFVCAHLYKSSCLFFFDLISFLFTCWWTFPLYMDELNMFMKERKKNRIIFN